MRQLTMIVAALFLSGQAICQYSKETEAYCSQASDLVQKRKYSQAISILLKAIKIDSLGQCGSQTGSAYAQLGSAYAQLGDTARAKSNLDVSLRLDPSNYSAKLQRAAIFSAQHKFDLAYKDLNELVDEYAWMTTPYIQRGHVYYAEGKFDLAEADLTKALQLETSRDTPDKEKQNSINKFLKEIRKHKGG